MPRSNALQLATKILAYASTVSQERDALREQVQRILDAGPRS